MAYGDDQPASSFFFPVDPNAPASLQMLQRRQAIAQAIAQGRARRKLPTTLGEGLTTLGQDIGDALAERSLSAQERAYEAQMQQRAKDLAAGGDQSKPPAAAAAASAANTLASMPADSGKPVTVVPVKVTTGDQQPAAGGPGQMGFNREALFDDERRLPAAADAQRNNITTAIENGPAVPPPPNPTLGASLLAPQLTIPSDEDTGQASPASADVTLTQPSTPTASADLGGQASDAQARWQNAIAGIETGGRRNPYAVIGPQTVRRNGTVDYPIGRYQIMASNVPQWSQAALGQTMSPQQLIGNKDAQDAIFNHRFGQYVNAYGENGAARAWFAGPGGMNNLNATDRLGTSVGGYGQAFMRNLGAGGGQPIRLASLNTGTMSDAQPINLTGPAIPPDDNADQPTPTDIKPAPIQLAQAGGVTPNLMSPRSVGAAPIQIQNAPNAAGVPQSQLDPEVRDLFVKPPDTIPPPPPTPITPREQKARQFLMTYAGDPRAETMARTVIEEEQSKRTFTDNRNAAMYQEQLLKLKSDQERYDKRYELAAAARVGNLQPWVVEKLVKSQSDANDAVNALE